MSRQATRSLFGFEPPDDLPDTPPGPDAPLAERMRPRTLDEYVGQGHLLGVGAARPEADRRRRPATLADPLGARPAPARRPWPDCSDRPARHPIRPPLGRALGGQGTPRGDRRGPRGEAIGGDGPSCSSTRSTVSTRVSRMRCCRRSRDGTVTLIGATTENPSFEVNAALLSRARVLTLQPLSGDDVAGHPPAGHGRPRTRTVPPSNPSLTDEDLGRLTAASGGDARVALTALESAVLATEPAARRQSRRVDQ